MTGAGGSGAPHPHLPEAGTLVIGAGVVGLSLALFLAREGEDVAVIDAGLAGASTANAGSLHVQLQPGFIRRFPAQAAALEASLSLFPEGVRFWQSLERDLDASFGLKLGGGVMVAETAAQLDWLAAKAARERRRGIDVTILGANELYRLAPYLRPGLVGAEFCAIEGGLDPLLANAALRRAAVAAGARFLAGETVLDLEPASVGVAARTASGRVKAGRVAVAAGAGSGVLAASIGLTLPTQASALHMSVTEPVAPAIGHLIQHAERPLTLKQLGNGAVVIGGGWPARLSSAPHAHGVVGGSIVGSAALAAHLVPAIGPARIVRSWAGANTTVDGSAAIGQAPGRRDVFFAVPGFGGYTVGPLIARILADLLMDNRPARDLSLFDPARFQ